MGSHSGRSTKAYPNILRHKNTDKSRRFSPRICAISSPLPYSTDSHPAPMRRFLAGSSGQYPCLRLRVCGYSRSLARFPPAHWTVMSRGLEVVLEVVMALFLMKILGEDVFMYLGVDIPNHHLVSPCRDYCLAISKPENMTLLRI